MATQNIYNFADKISSDPALLREFLQKYTDLLVSVTDTDDIVREWREMVYTDLYTSCRDEIGGVDNFIETVAHEFPDLLENEYGVDTSLAS